MYNVFSNILIDFYNYIGIKMSKIFTETLTSTSGQFYIGDLCYCMSFQEGNNDGWGDFVDKSLSQQNYYNNDRNARPNTHDVVKTKYFVPALNRDVSVLSVSTQYGDGGYCFEVNNEKVTALNNPSDISVDAGLIGVVAKEDMLEECPSHCALMIQLPDNQKTIKYQLVIGDDDCSCWECGGSGEVVDFDSGEYETCYECNGTGTKKMKAHFHQILNENDELIVEVVS